MSLTFANRIYRGSPWKMLFICILIWEAFLVSNILITAHYFEQKYLPRREAAKRRETRWSCRSRFLNAPGEHFKTSMTPDKTKDFFTDCRAEIAAVINEHRQNNAFRYTFSSALRTFCTFIYIKQHRRIPQHRPSRSSQ